MGGIISVDIQKGLREDLDNCPLCQAPPPWGEFVDADTVFMSCHAAKFHYVRDGFAFNPMLFAHDCKICGATVHAVEVDLIANPDISDDWADKYFNRNETIEEPEKPYTVTRQKPDAPPLSWMLTRTETPEGWLDRHFLPLLVDGEAGGQNGLASCSGEAIWGLAAALVDQFWEDMAAMNGCALPCRYEREAEVFDDDIPF